MNKELYKIEYLNSETLEIVEEILEFESMEWAKDYAYAKADKGFNKVTLIKEH